jgi:serine dehydrogenase proteinase
MMRLYPQPRGRRPSVEYIPLPYDTPKKPQRSRPGT